MCVSDAVEILFHLAMTNAFMIESFLTHSMLLPFFVKIILESSSWSFELTIIDLQLLEMSVSLVQSYLIVLWSKLDMMQRFTKLSDMMVELKNLLSRMFFSMIKFLEKLSVQSSDACSTRLNHCVFLFRFLVIFLCEWCWKFIIVFEKSSSNIMNQRSCVQRLECARQCRQLVISAEYETQESTTYRELFQLYMNE